MLFALAWAGLTAQPFEAKTASGQNSFAQSFTHLVSLSNAQENVSAPPVGANGGVTEIGVTSTNVGRTFWTTQTEFQGIKVFPRNDAFDPNLMTTWREGGNVVSGTNLERMATGRAPIGTDGKSVNLHHMVQSNDSATAEMTQTFHQQNSAVMHINPNTIPSGIDRSAFDAWKARYWTNRSTNFGPK
ncbi:hypothetical protein RA876_15905 [Rhodoferax antarcticus]|nr:hypothetical protein RA876_15905 [Rhodoferax antarcticus]